MTRLFQPLMFLAAFYAAIANAGDFEIYVTFANDPGQPARLVLVSQYCMSKVPGFIPLTGGSAGFTVYTNGGVFSKCGWVHSSATFEAQNDQKEKKLVFEFYKDAGVYPYLKIIWPSSGANCQISPSGLYLVCGTL